MTIDVEVYYDFRSPYAYFASKRIGKGPFADPRFRWIWRPVSIDVPSFVYKNQVFFGNDRLDLLAWTVEQDNRP